VRLRVDCSGKNRAGSVIRSDGGRRRSDDRNQGMERTKGGTPEVLRLLRRR
jgi:hypothetical protein